jgi:hypothetical protein
MSKIRDIKEKYPILSWSVIDLLSEIDKSGTNKYLNLMLKIIEESGALSAKGQIAYDLEHEKKYWLMRINSKGFNKTIEDMDSDDILKYIMFCSIVDNITDNNFFSLINDFMSLVEDNYIKGLDVNQVTTMEQVKFLVNTHMIDKISNEMSKQVIKVHEDDKWLLVRPITWKSSLKYGSSTKWCTSSDTNPDHFFRYSERGILLYCINKVKGTKTAFFKTTADKYDTETSFWNEKDTRIDSMESDLDAYILDIIRNIEKVSNRELGGEIYKKSFAENYEKKQPSTINEMGPSLEEYENPIPRHLEMNVEMALIEELEREYENEAEMGISEEIDWLVEEQ